MIFLLPKFSWVYQLINYASVDKQGHPLGLQLIGKALDEQKILNIGYAFEKNCGFKNEIKSGGHEQRKRFDYFIKGEKREI